MIIKCAATKFFIIVYRIIIILTQNADGKPDSNNAKYVDMIGRGEHSFKLVSVIFTKFSNL
jgi:hypothetical protein